MRLTRLFVLTTGVLLTLVSVMLARSVMQDWHTVSAAQHGLQAMALAHQAIRVAELASFERGPTNAVLGDSDTPDPARRSRLATARQSSDAALATALQALASAPPAAEQQAAAVQLAKARDQLAQTRRAVDQVAAPKKTAEAKRQLPAERESLIGHLRQASSVDYLTGLLNRREFTAHANQQLALARRHNWPVALVVFDIDHFKTINDRFGHATGDAALVQIAAIAQLEFRAADTLTRYGGEEFVALITDCRAETAALLAERLRAAIASASFTTAKGKPFDVTSSFGLATANANAVSSIDTLFQQADKALYEAKAQGRNRVSCGTVTIPAHT